VQLGAGQEGADGFGWHRSGSARRRTCISSNDSLEVGCQEKSSSPCTHSKPRFGNCFRISVTDLRLSLGCTCIKWPLSYSFINGLGSPCGNGCAYPDCFTALLVDDDWPAAQPNAAVCCALSHFRLHLMHPHAISSGLVIPKCACCCFHRACERRCDNEIHLRRSPRNAELPPISWTPASADTECKAMLSQRLKFHSSRCNVGRTVMLYRLKWSRTAAACVQPLHVYTGNINVRFSDASLSSPRARAAESAELV
jgi:hypothetical protein